MEAAAGLEPANNGFAIRRLSHLAMPPLTQLRALWATKGTGWRARVKFWGVMAGQTEG